VVAQLGVDTHYSDPLSSLNLTLRGYIYMVSRIVELVARHSSGRLLALGGGGYNLEVVPAAWNSVLGLMKGAPLQDYLPPYWAEMFINLTGGEPLSLPDIELKVGELTKKRLTGELAQTLDGLKGKLSQIHGIF
jgi:acetoin utilization protein AcuC